MKDYYAILEIGSGSSVSDIRDAYRRLAKKYHPDVNKSADAHEKFIEISEAYEYLIHQTRQSGRKYSTVSNERQRDTENQKNDEYERLKREARVKAQEQAKMRYEEFKKQHEAFQRSGINDLALLFKVVVRITLIPLFFFLVLIPFYIAWHNEWTMVFLLVITWPIAGIIAWFIHDNRKNYFVPGKFYYSVQHIRQIYKEKKPTAQRCYYCPPRMADSVPYQLELLKLKDIKVKSGGFRQHTANYINESFTIIIPRSRKAFIVHSVNTVIKVVSIFSCLLFLPLSSIFWRIILGLGIGGLISLLILVVTRTKSNISYLMNYGTIFRVGIWLFFISLISHFSFSPFDIETSDYVYFVVFSIVLFDSFLMQLVNFVFGRFASKPIIRQYAEMELKLNEGYRVYNDVSVISVVYPFFKWIFG